MTQRYYVIDTETTDAGPTASVCEFGFIEIDKNFNILREVETLIDPEQMISPGASGIHGLVNADVEDAPTLQEFFYADFDGGMRGPIPGPAVIIGHRVSFDLRFIGPYIQDPRQEICTLRWARKLYPNADDHKLSTLIYSLDLPRSAGAHRVMADVMSAYYLAKHICERGGVDLEQLSSMSADPMELAMFPFGKHKGVPFKEVPKSYLRWAQENMKDLDMDMAYTIDLHLNKKKNNG